MTNTTRTIILNLDSAVGNKIYWLLKAIKEQFPDIYEEVEE